MPSAFSQPAVVPGLRVAAPGSLIASGRTVTWTGDVARVEDDGADEALLTVTGPPATEPTVVEAAAAAAVAAVMQAARVILGLGMQEP
jgi:hypothetical protein